MSELADATTRGQTAADHLAAQIETMDEGDRLGTRKELSARLGIAAATLNEAIRLLQARGLVTLRPGPKGGIFAAKPGPLAQLGQSLAPLRDQPHHVEGALEVQQSLRSLAALDAVRQRTEQDVAALREQILLLAEAVADERAFAAALHGLDRTIAGISTNQILHTVYRGVLAYVEANGQRSASPASSAAERRRLLRIHQQLVDAIAEQDEAACRRILRALDR
ncbi:FadR/GntR family transcriptional regulator [Amycolatopsis japonica]|uniref:FadR/GntR family transcriptional regulator n=1 Tax=Amycolatopsis japonica TaxID=208439 RepID=UPI00366E4778